MRSRSRYDRRRDFDGREHPRDSRGRFVDDDEDAYRGRSYEDDDFGDERGENERSRYFGEEFGDYPGGYTRQGRGAGYDEIGGAVWERLARHGDDDEDDSDYRHWRREQMKKLDTDYGEWRRERRKKFAEEFDKWRSGRTPSSDRSSKS